MGGIFQISFINNLESSQGFFTNLASDMVEYTYSTESVEEADAVEDFADNPTVYLVTDVF